MLTDEHLSPDVYLLLLRRRGVLKDDTPKVLRLL